VVSFFNHRSDSRKVAQQSVQPTGGILPPFSSIFLASGFSCSPAESRPAHQRLTQTVMPPISARLVSVPRNPSMNLESQRMEDKTFTYLLEAYKIAISYFSDYANRVWTRFNILLAIDVGLATLLWNTWQGNQQQNMSILLPFLGLVVSLLLYVQSAQDKYAIRHQMRRINQIRVILEEKTGQKDIPALFTPLDDTDLQKREFLFEGITSWRSNFISVTRIPAITSLLFMLFWIGMIIITLSK